MAHASTHAHHSHERTHSTAPHDHQACHDHSHHHPNTNRPDDGKVIDPVCGMTVDPATSQHRFDHEGHRFHFCSSRCQQKFAADPAQYLRPAAEPPHPQPPGTVYTCPMHPEIRQEGPGSCPICGMALEPLVATAEDAPNPELLDMTRRFRVGAALSAPVVVLEMGAHMPGLGLHHAVSMQMSTWIQFVLATPVVLWAGWPFFVRAWASVVNRSLNMFSLIALGTGAAYLYSLFATFAPGLFPSGFRNADGMVAVYFEAAAVITVGYTFLVRRLWGGAANAELKRLMLDHAFGFAREVRFEVGRDNLRSRRAMEKIGAELLGERFEPAGSAAAPHVVYRLRAPG